MALYRMVSMSFWTDAKVVEDFTPEDKYFYLYLFTNPHTNLCGCYELSLRVMANETGYSRETIERLVERFKTLHKVIDYSPETKEVLLINWYKYNWTSSEKYRKPLAYEISLIKDGYFKQYLEECFGASDTVSIRYQYRSDTSNTNTNTITNTISNTNTDSNSISNTNNINTTYRYTREQESKKPTKHHYGEYKHVLLTDDEYKKLVQERGQAKTEAAITFLDEYLEMNGKSYKSCYLALRKWVFDALEEKKTSAGQKVVNKVAQQLDDFYTMASEWAERG